MTDKRTIQLIVGTLAVALIGAEGASVALAILERPIPELLDDIAKFVTGAISAFLVRTSVDPGQLQAEKPNVEEKSPSDPIPSPYNHEAPNA